MTRTRRGVSCTASIVTLLLFSMCLKKGLNGHQQKLLTTANAEFDSTTQYKIKIMNTAKRKRLQNKGWKFGHASDFLNLSPEEATYVEIKLALSKHLQETRREKKLSQEQLAQRLKSSQSRVAKMEAGDPSVSLDLLVRSLLALGASRKTLSRTLA